VNSNLKIQTPEAITLIEKIKAELKKRAELKAKRMLLKVPKQREEPGQCDLSRMHAELTPGSVLMTHCQYCGLV
jgi:hypothetical protein